MKALCISMLCFKINIKFFFTLSIDSMRITDIDCTSDNEFPFWNYYVKPVCFLIKPFSMAAISRDATYFHRFVQFSRPLLKSCICRQQALS